MAYEKTNWEPREGSDLDRFEKANETAKSVILRNSPNAVTRKGTPFSAQNMNKIEQGIFEAHEMVEAEVKERKASDGNLQAAISGEIADRKNAIQSHNESEFAHPDIRTIINQFIGLPVWNSDNHTIVFTARDGSTIEVDLPLEDLARDIDFDPATKEIILIKHDGSEIRIDVGDLVDVYTGSLGTHIQITIGENNQINAILRGGSVTDAELSAALLAKISGKLDATAQAADSAKLGGQLPGTYAKQADMQAADQNSQNQINALSPSEMGNVAKFTFIIDSDAKLKQWADNAAGNDYSRVLVRAGTWTYALGVISGGSRNVIDISNGRTKSIDAETGSRINISVSYTNNSPAVLFNALYGNQDITISNLSLYVTANISFSGDTYNITVLNNFNILNNCKIGLIVNLTNVYDISVSTFVISNCNRLYNCKNEYTLNGNTGTGDAYGVGFSRCNFLYSCIGTGQNGAFAECRTGFGCRGIGNIAAQRSFEGCYMEQVSGTTRWANTAAGGYNYSGA